ncbi:MAG: TonB-dependent receptor domain-containing protein [Candidatus Glassbacteria bacterium]
MHIRISCFWRNRSAILIVPVFVLISIVPAALHSQTTGKIEGRVLDSQTAQPLQGTQVTIEGTLLGNITDDEGYYFILNVPVGLQSVKAQMIGYRSVTVKDVRVLPGQTHTVDFELNATVIELPGQEVVGERDPLMVRDNTVSKERFTGERQLQIPVDDINQVVRLQAGVTNSINIRGGRSTETATYVDGINIKSYHQDSANLNVGENAVEAVDVITGGYSSDFGDAQSGIINIVTKEGGSYYTGQFRVETDAFMPKGSNYGFNRAQASIGGPVPALADNLTFFFSAEATGKGDKGPKAAGFLGRTEDLFEIAGFFNKNQEAQDFLGEQLDLIALLNEAKVKNPNLPILHLEDYRSDKGEYPGRKVNNDGDQLRVQSKIAWQPLRNAKLTGTLLLDRDQGVSYNRARIFFTDFRNAVNRDVNMMGIVGYTHTLSQSAERSTNLQFRTSFQRTALHSGSVFDFSRPDERGGYKDLGFNDLTSVLNFRIGNIPIFLDDLRGSDITSLEFVQNNYQFEIDESTNRGGMNPFGLPAGGFYDENTGWASSISNLWEDRWNFRIDLDSQIDRIHRVKGGADLKFWEIDRYNNSLRRTTFLSYYTANPQMQSFYIEDRMDFRDLVIDLGFRVDSFRAGVRAPRIIGDQNSAPSGDAENPNSREGGGVEVPRTTEISPRLGVAHPVTEKTQIRLSYGSKFQVPRFQYLYTAINTDVAQLTNLNQFFGNPYLGFRKTTSFEIGMTTLLSDNWVLDLVGYNRDIDGNVAARYLQQNPEMPFLRTYTNVDNGNVKGLDLTLRKRFKTYYSMDIVYTLLFARTTGTDPENFVRNEGFFLGGDYPPLPPVETSPNDFDQTHTFNYQFSVKLPSDFMEHKRLGRILRNTGFYLVMHANSGKPYTRQDMNFEFIEHSNMSRRGWDFWADLRINKDITWKGLEYSVYADIKNLFDNVNLSTRRINVFSSAGMTNGVYQTTGSPISDGNTVADAIDGIGLSDPSLYTGPRATDINGDGVADENDLPEIIRRVDFNGDGQVTIEEELAMRILAEGARDWNTDNYDRPREVRLGFEVRF